MIIIELVVKIFKSILSFFTSPKVGNDPNETDLELLVNLIDKIKSVENYTDYDVVKDFASEVLNDR